MTPRFDVGDGVEVGPGSRNRHDRAAGAAEFRCGAAAVRP